MKNQIIIPQSSSLQTLSALDALREAAVTDILRGYGATKRYAEGLIGILGETFYLYEHNSKEESAKPTLEEGAKFRKALKDGGHSNPSVAWTRVRAEAKKMVEAMHQAENAGDTGEGEGEGDTPGAKNVRSLTLRLVEDLGTLFKACKREADRNNLDEKQTQAQTHIAQALQALGVDLTMIK